MISQSHYLIKSSSYILRIWDTQILNLLVEIHKGLEDNCVILENWQNMF